MGVKIDWIKGLVSVQDRIHDTGMLVVPGINDVAGIYTANDAFGRLKSALSGIGNMIAVTVAPALTVLWGWLTDLVGAVGRFGKKLGGLVDVAVEVVVRSVVVTPPPPHRTWG